MLLTQVGHQGFVGTSTLLAQAVKYLMGHPRIVTKSSWDIQHSVHEEPDLALVSSEQLVARFTYHVATRLNSHPPQCNFCIQRLH
jgi:hypothetical protein